tara:strand:+ start:723 stop:2297 length:1575 start_codon:yes stop_codon:yes gene_type:complete
MKFIGQFIQNFIARFRSDVYLENIESGTIASGGNLGLDSNNKIVKATEASGDITAVTITTDSGGGSAASDSEGSADFSILGGTGASVLNSGTTITIRSQDNEIDHDSLQNFVVSEHYDWSDNISATATIDTNNITDLHGAGVDGAVTQLLTDSGSGRIASQAYLNFRNTSNTSTLSLISNEDTGDFFTLATTTHGATTLTTVDDDATAAHFEIAADGNITLDAAGDIALEAAGDDITMEGAHITLESTATNDPTVTIQNTTEDANSPRLRFFKRRENSGTLQAGQDGDGAGEILFNSYNDASTPGGKNYAKIEGFIDDATNGQESGQLKLQVASHDGGVETGLQLTGGDVDAEVDVTIGNGTASVTTIAGSLRPKGQIFIKQGSFTDDCGTDRVYFPMAGTTENTSSVGVTIPFLAPVGGKLLKIHWRTNKNHSGQTTTFALANWDPGDAFTTGNATDLGTKAVTPANQNNVTTIDFQTGITGTNAFNAGDTLAISMQNSSAINAGSNTKYWFSVVFELDFSSY